MFDELLAANATFAESFTLRGLSGKAAKGLAVVTCIDTRIEPLQMLGLVPGDAKIIRAAGGRATDDVLRSLVLATNLLNVHRVVVMHHTDCAMVSTNEAIAASVSAACGHDASDWDFWPITDPDTDLAADVERVRSCELIPAPVVVAGWRYDVDTGRVHHVVS